jgi:carboxypeptidase Taq
MEPNFSTLLSRMQELRDLAGVIGLATWDQETYLPAKAHDARASQLATLQGLYHERLIDPRLGELLMKVQAAEGDEVAMVRVLGQERDRAVRVPSRLVKELAEAQSQALATWRKARDAKDFQIFRPALEKLLALRREQADAYGFADGEERYDALLEGYEPGMRVKRLSPVLTQLKAKLVPLVEKLCARPPPANVFAGKSFDVEAQWRFTVELLHAMGFDLEAGRQDKSIHPFTGGTHATDVRLTTRLSDDNPLPALFGTIHEGGHGLYEQGFSPEHFRTPLAAAPSMGIHESQSRLWENVVGRSRPFWSHFYPGLQKHFPAQLGAVSLDAFLAAVNRVEKSFIRVEADEVTYNLHIVLRYELELGMLRGELQVKDLEAAWNEKTKALLGLTPANPVQGVLQDIHWAWGELGYFPTYALGNLYSASLYASAKKQVPGLEEGIARGQLLPLRDWLRSKIHREGYRMDAEERIRHVTGHGLTDEDFISYLKTKYSSLYDVAL